MYANPAAPEFGRASPGTGKAVSAVEIRLLPVRDLASGLAAWTSLARDAIEPNIHLEPEFLQAHLTHLLESRELGFLAVYATSAGVGGGKLAALFPLKTSKRQLGFGFQRGWKSRYVTLGVPLVARETAPEAIDAFLDWLQNGKLASSGFLLPAIPLEGPFAELLRQRLAARGLSFIVTAAHERAVLLPAAGARAMPQKQLREWRRLERKLAQHGDINLKQSVKPADVRAAAERFLALEATGWKGRAGTALLQDPGRAAFLRTMSRSLARDGRIRFDELFAGGKLAAASITLFAPPHAYYWKIAYDESLAAASPGLQLTYHVTKCLEERKELERIDSCAIAGNPLMKNTWRSTMKMGDVIIPRAARPGLRFTLAMRRETGWQSLRTAAKRAVYRINGKKWS